MLALAIHLVYRDDMSVFIKDEHVEKLRVWLWKCRTRWWTHAKTELKPWPLAVTGVVCLYMLIKMLHGPEWLCWAVAGFGLMLLSRLVVWLVFLTGVLLHVYSGALGMFTPVGFYMVCACIWATILRIPFLLLIPCWNRPENVPYPWYDRTRDEWVHKDGRKEPAYRQKR